MLKMWKMLKSVNKSSWIDYGEGKSSDENVKSAQSLVKSAFFFGYVITQVIFLPINVYQK